MITREEELIFKTAFMQFVGKAYHGKNWVIQIHYGCKRDNNNLMYKELGPDMTASTTTHQEVFLFAQFSSYNAQRLITYLSRTILYNRNLLNSIRLYCRRVSADLAGYSRVYQKSGDHAARVDLGKGLN